MREIYVFYADVFLIQNFFMDVTALITAKWFLRKQRKAGWIFLAAALGSVIGLCLLLGLKNYLLYCIFTHFFLNTGMVLIAFGRMGMREFLKTWFITYIAVLLCGGILEWMGGIGAVPVMAVLVAGGVLAHVMEERRNFGNNLFWAEIRDGERCMRILAYWDSGNQLRDIYTGKAVSILSYDRFKQWTGEQEFIRYVPFSSLGAKDGFLPVTDVEELIIYNGKRAERIRHAAIGAADRGILEPKEYDLILHASLGKQI